MKRTLTILAIPAAILAQSLLTQPVAAQESVWQKSQQLEAAAKYPEALAALDGLEDRTDGGYVLSRRAWLNYLLGRHQEAISHYKRALERNPKSHDARLGITLPLLAQQRWREAGLYARQVIYESNWDYTAHARLLAVEEGMRDWSTLAEHADRLTDRYPSDPTVWVYLARARAWQGDVKEARKAYSRVLDRYPGHLEATRYLSSNP